MWNLHTVPTVTLSGRPVEGDRETRDLHDVNVLASFRERATCLF